VEATGQDMALGARALPIKHTLTACYPARTFGRAIEVTNARTGCLTYEMATCETAFSRTVTLTANDRKIPRPIAGSALFLKRLSLIDWQGLPDKGQATRR